jgi:hypothetical protein
MPAEVGFKVGDDAVSLGDAELFFLEPHLLIGNLPGARGQGPTRKAKNRGGRAVVQGSGFGSRTF